MTGGGGGPLAASGYVQQDYVIQLANGKTVGAAVLDLPYGAGAFTAVAVLQLVEAGKLRLDSTIGEVLPEYPSVGRNITVHQLLTHTSGIPNFTDFPEYVEWRQQPVQTRQLLEWFWDRPLDFEPGLQFRYSNSGYQVLGAIIERVSHQKYAEYLEQHVDARPVPAHPAPAGARRSLPPGARLPGRGRHRRLRRPARRATHGPGAR